jgi:hypothetical protein
MIDVTQCNTLDLSSSNFCFNPHLGLSSGHPIFSHASSSGMG